MSEKSLWLFIFILLYAAYCFFWGVRGSKYNSDNPERYYLANRNISSWVFFFAATAATFAGLTVISQTSLVFHDGFQYVGTAFVAITVPLGSIFFFKRQWMLSRKFGYITPGEMYYDYYKSDTIRVLSVIVTFFVAIPIIAVLFGATGFLVNTLTEGYVSRDLSMWAIATIVLFYVTSGGFKSTVSIGVVQSWLYFLSIFFLGIIVYPSPLFRSARASARSFSCSSIGAAPEGGESVLLAPFHLPAANARHHSDRPLPGRLELFRLRVVGQPYEQLFNAPVTERKGWPVLHLFVPSLCGARKRAERPWHA